MVASVPDETKRTCSTDGSAAQIRSAISISPSVGAPNEVPAAAACFTARTTAVLACPRIRGPQEPT